jgi:hypothetical protein
MAVSYEPTVPAGVMFVGMDVTKETSTVGFASSKSSDDYLVDLFIQVSAFSLTSIFTSEDHCVQTQLAFSFFFRLDELSPKYSEILCGKH